MSTLKIKRENGKIFCPLADSWHIETPEEKVRQEYIKILVEDYGYSLDQMAQEIKVNNSQRGQGKARADIVIWKSKQDKIESKAAFIVVECKAENVRIREEDYYQGYNYASWAGASFFVTTNEKETKYFNVDKDYLPKELVEVVAIPTAEEALNDKKVKDILSKTKTFTRDDFTKILRTCHNIIRNNDKLSPEAAFDEISKILFMKIKYEREQRGAKVFTKNEFEEKEKWFEKEIRPSLKGTPKDLPYMQFLFYNTKEALIAKYKEKYGEAYEKALKQVNDNIGKSLLSLYDVGSMSGLTEVLFMERCLRLLKKGGRMGMVLPEGVLNTSNLQKIREYFEGKAKIILICSIPQDVFIAAGATVKPSLVFFKRFTEEEELQYLGAKTRAEKEIRQKYIGQIKALQEKIVEEKSKKLKVKALIAVAEKELRDLEKAIIEEAKPLTKEYFDYEIPIAMVEDAGITSTGAVSAGNQLPTLQDEYKEYRIAKKLWNEANSVVSYIINSQGRLFRTSDGKEVELKW